MSTSILKLERDKEKEILLKLVEEKKNMENKIMRQEERVALLDELFKKQEIRDRQIGHHGYYHGPREEEKIRLYTRYNFNIAKEVEKIALTELNEASKAFDVSLVRGILKQKYPDRLVPKSRITGHLNKMVKEGRLDKTRLNSGYKKNIYSVKSS